MFIEKTLAATTVADADFNGFNIVSGTAATGITLQGIAVKVVNFILVIAVILAVVYLIYSGILYLTAAGNEANADKGRKGIVNAVIGIIVITLAFVILRVANKAAVDAVNNP